jgi:hypothetical protein
MMRTTRLSLFAVILTLVAPAFVQAAGPSLVNPGFDDDNDSPTGWFAFNNAFVSQNVPPHSAPNTLKAFGPNYVAPAASGAFQGDFPASPGQVWSASAWARIDSSDPMHPADMAQILLTFLPSSFANPPAVSPPITTSTLPLDTWKQFSVVGVAPPGTTAVRLALMHVQLSPLATTGSIFFDDASLAIVPEPTSVVFAALGFFGWLAFARRRTNGLRSR